MGGSLSGFEHCQTMAETLQQSAKLHPDREVFIFYDTERKLRNPFTAQQIYQLGGRFASRLHQHGFGKGDVIVNTLPNSPERVITDIGIMLAGCTAMQGQIVLADGKDFFSSVNRARASAVILCHGASPAWSLLNPFICDVSSGLTSNVSCKEMPDLKAAILVTREKGHFAPLLEDLKTSSDEIFNSQGIGPEDYAYIHVTSGSTGYGKLVPRTHRQYLDLNRNAHEGFHSLYPFKKEDIFFSDKLVGWMAGFPLPQYCMGATRLLTDLWYPGDVSKDVTALWRMLKAENCTVAFPSLNVVIAIANSVEGVLESRLKVLFLGGKPITKNTTDKCFKFAENLHIGYAATESGLIAEGLFSDAHVESDKYKSFNSGKPSLNTDVRIVDADGREVPVGENGEIEVKGPDMFSGYFNVNETGPSHLDRLSPFTNDGWFRTQDYGFCDEEGNIYVKGRSNDVIHHGTKLLYPSWLEEIIATHPDVQDVCVVPVPDPDLFHAICACVTINKGCAVLEEELKQFCERLFLTEDDATPMPEYFMIMDDDFPETFTKKVDRQKLKKMAAQKFGPKDVLNEQEQGIN